MDPSKDYYAVLGVLPSIESAAIRAVYLALLKKYHPDICKNLKYEANIKTKELNEAYSILGDDKYRERYDMLRANHCGTYINNKKQNNKNNMNKYNVNTSCEESRAGQRRNKAKAMNYRDPWAAKPHGILHGGNRLPVFVVGVVVSVVLAFIISAFAGSV